MIKNNERDILRNKTYPVYFTFLTSAFFNVIRRRHFLHDVISSKWKKKPTTDTTRLLLNDGIVVKTCRKTLDREITTCFFKPNNASH